MKQYLKYKLVTSSLVKNEITCLLISCTSWIIELVIYVFINILLPFQQYFWIRYFLEIIISLILSMSSPYIISGLQPHKPSFYRISEYIIENFSLNFFNRIKKIVVISLGSISLILLQFNQVDNFLISIYIIQYMVIFILIDQMQQNSAMARLISVYYNYPRVKLYVRKSQLQIQENHFPGHRRSISG